MERKSSSYGDSTRRVNNEAWDEVSDLDYLASHHDDKDQSKRSLPQDKILLVENEQLKKQLDAVRSDRVLLQQRLVETRDELESTNSNFQGQIRRLQDELEAVQLQQNRQLEEVSTSILHEELQELMSINEQVKDQIAKSPPATPLNLASTPDGLPELEKQVSELQERLQSRADRESELEQEVQEAREQTEDANQHLHETQLQVKMLQQEMDAAHSEDDEIDDDIASVDNTRVALLRDQRTVLQQRVRQLLQENGQLRRERSTFQHENQQQARTIETLEKSMEEVQQDEKLEEVMAHRQMMEWKRRSRGLEQELETTHRATQKESRSHRRIRNELAEKVQRLEIERKELIEHHQRDRHDLDQQKNLLKRNVQSLEAKLVDDFRILKNSQQSTEAREEAPKQSKTADSVSTVRPANSVASPPRVDRSSLDPHDSLVGRLQNAESDLKTSRANEAALNAKIKELTKVSDKAIAEAERAKEHTELLQTYLEASTSSPTKSKQRRQSARERQLKQEKEKTALQKKELTEERIAEPREGSIEKSVLSIMTSPPEISEEITARQDVQHDSQKKFTSSLQQTLEGEKMRLSVRQKERAQKAKDFEQSLPEPRSRSRSFEGSIHSLESSIGEIDHMQTMQQKLDDQLSELERKKERLRRSRAERKSVVTREFVDEDIGGKSQKETLPQASKNGTSMIKPSTDDLYGQHPALQYAATSPTKSPPDEAVANSFGREPNSKNPGTSTRSSEGAETMRLDFQRRLDAGHAPKPMLVDETLTSRAGGTIQTTERMAVEAPLLQGKSAIVIEQEGSLRELQNLVSQRERELEKQRERTESLKYETNKLNEENRRLASGTTELNEEKTTLEARVVEITKELEETVSREMSLKNDLLETVGGLEETKADAQNMQKELQERLAALASMSGQLQPPVDENDRIEFLEREIDELNEENKRLASNSTKILEEKVALQHRVADMSEEFKETISREIALKRDLLVSVDELDKSRTDAQNIGKELQDRLSALASLSGELQQAAEDSDVASSAVFSLPITDKKRSGEASHVIETQDPKTWKIPMDLSRALDEANLLVEDLEVESDELRQQKQQLKDTQEQLRDDLQAAQKKILESAARESAVLAESQKSKDDLESFMGEADTHHWKAEDRLASFRNDLDDAHNRIRAITSELENAQSERKDLERMKRALLEDLETVNRETDETKGKASLLEATIMRLGTSNEELEEKLHMMDDQEYMQQDLISTLFEELSQHHTAWKGLSKKESKDFNPDIRLTSRPNGGALKSVESGEGVEDVRQTLKDAADSFQVATNSDDYNSELSESIAANPGMSDGEKQAIVLKNPKFSAKVFKVSPDEGAVSSEASSTDVGSQERETVVRQVPKFSADFFNISAASSTSSSLQDTSDEASPASVSSTPAAESSSRLESIPIERQDAALVSGPKVGEDLVAPKLSSVWDPIEVSVLITEDISLIFSKSSQYNDTGTDTSLRETPRPPFVAGSSRMETDHVDHRSIANSSAECESVKAAVDSVIKGGGSSEVVQQAPKFSADFFKLTADDEDSSSADSPSSASSAAKSEEKTHVARKIPSDNSTSSSAPSTSGKLATPHEGKEQIARQTPRFTADFFKIQDPPSSTSSALKDSSDEISAALLSSTDSGPDERVVLKRNNNAWMSSSNAEGDSDASGSSSIWEPPNLLNFIAENVSEGLAKQKPTEEATAHSTLWDLPSLPAILGISYADTELVDECSLSSYSVECESTAEATEQELERLRKGNLNILREHASQKAEFASICQQLEDASSTVAQLKKEVEVKNAENETLKNECDQVSIRAEKQQGRLESASQALNDMEEQIGKLDRDKESLENERAGMSAQITRHTDHLDNARAQLNDMEGGLLSCQSELGAAELRTKALEGQVLSLESKTRGIEEEKASLLESGSADHAGVEKESLSRALFCCLPKHDESKDVEHNSLFSLSAGTSDREDTGNLIKQEETPSLEQCLSNGTCNKQQNDLHAAHLKIDMLEEQLQLKADLHMLQGDFVSSVLAQNIHLLARSSKLKSTIHKLQTGSETMGEQSQLKADEHRLEEEFVSSNLAENKVLLAHSTEIDSALQNLKATQETMEEHFYLKADEAMLQADFLCCLIGDLEESNERLEEQLQAKEDDEYLQQDFLYCLSLESQHESSQAKELRLSIRDLETKREQLEDEMQLMIDEESLQIRFNSSLSANVIDLSSQIDGSQSIIDAFLTEQTGLEELNLQKDDEICLLQDMVSQLSVELSSKSAQIQLHESRLCTMESVTERLENECLLKQDEAFLREEVMSVLSVELLHTSTQRKDLQNAVSDLESDSQTLSRESNEKSLQLERQLRKVESACAQLSQMEEQISCLEDEKKALRDDCEESWSKVKKQQEGLERASTRLSDMDMALLSSQEAADTAESRVKYLEGKLRNSELNNRGMVTEIRIMSADNQTLLRQVGSGQEAKDGKITGLQQAKHRDDLQSAQTKIEELTAREAAALQELENLKKRVESVMAESDEQHWEAEDTLVGYRNDIDESHDRIRDLSVQVEKVQSERNEMERMKTVFLADLEKENDRADKMEAKIDSLEANIIDLETEREELEAQLEKMENGDHKQQDLISSLSAELSHVSARELCLREEVEGRQNEMASSVPDSSEKDAALQSQITDLLVEKRTWKIERDDMEKQMEKQQERLRSASMQLNEMEEEIEDLVNENESLRSDRDGVAARIKKQEQRLESARTHLNDMEGSLLACQDELETAELQIKALEGQNYGLRSRKNELEFENGKLLSARESVDTRVADGNGMVPRAFSILNKQRDRDEARTIVEEANSESSSELQHMKRSLLDDLDMANTRNDEAMSRIIELETKIVDLETTTGDLEELC